MAKFTRLEVLNAIINDGLVPVFYHSDIDIAKKVLTAVSEGGSQIFEFTNRGDQAFMVFSELFKFRNKDLPHMKLGVGSVVDAGTASLYICCGADFVVGPILNEEVAKVCNRRKIPYSPGCGSASEISRAEELGVEICKIFPGEEVGGPTFVKALIGPMPWCKVMPTGGVDCTRESLEAWFKAGVACVGMGSNLITKELVAKGDYEGIAENVKKVLFLIKELRKS